MIANSVSNGNAKILDNLDRLTSDGGSYSKNEVGSYHCPRCKAKNFKIKNDGKFDTYGCDCDKSAIYKAIVPFEPQTRPDRWQKPKPAPQCGMHWIYKDSDGNPLIKITRRDYEENGKMKRSFPQSHWNGTAWTNGVPDEIKHAIPLYRIYDAINRTAIANGSPLLLVEGESTAAELIKCGIAATTSIGGSGKWASIGAGYREQLAGANLLLCPDRDSVGLKHMSEVAIDFPDALFIYADPTSWEWGNLPADKGFDLKNWIEAGATAEQILGAIEPRRIPKTQETKPKKERLKFNDNDDEKPAKRSIADQLIDIGLESNIAYFVTPEEIVYADVMEAETRYTLAIRDKAFKQYLRSQIFDKTGRSPGSEAVQQAIDTLEALAVRKPEKREVFVRLASHDDRIYIDLADESWKAIEVSRDGWRVVSDAPIRFMRGASAPLPMPIEGGDVEDLKRLCQFDDNT